MGGRCRRLLPIGVILLILDWTAMRGGYGGCIVFDGCVGCGRRRRAAGFVICETELTLATMTTFSSSADVIAQRSSCGLGPWSAVGMDAEMRYVADVGGGMVSIKG